MPTQWIILGRMSNKPNDKLGDEVTEVDESDYYERLHTAMKIFHNEN
jgi:hypothetical protein